MRRHISIFMFLLGVFAAVGLSAFADDANYGVMRLTPVGYRLGETGDVTAYASSVVTVTPDETSNVTSNKPVTITAVLNRDYKVVRWQKFDVDPTIRTDEDPIEEFGEQSETVSVEFNPNVEWMYVAVVLEYDPVRTVRASLSSFARGTVSVSPDKKTYQKGEVVTLTAQPAEGYSFVRWSDGNADHVRKLTVDGDIDLTAYIEPDSSRVSFSAGAGALLGVTSKRVSYDNDYGELPVPTRTGAKFSGWTDDENSLVTEKTKVNRVADHTLYASWSTLLYEIAWEHAGRGNGKVEGTGTYAYGSQPTLRAVPYEGSDFAGWADGETRNPRRITVLSNALYVAAFDIATYGVTFTYRDASGNLVRTGPTTVEHGGKVDPPDIPEWPDHPFANWSTEEYKKVTRNLNVEAIYDTITYPVTFAYHDWQGNSVTTMPQHVASGGKANPPDRSVVDNWAGHTFKGWAPDYNVIQKETLCEAIYETNTYTVTFSYCDASGREMQYIEYVRYGEKVPFDYAESMKNLWTGHVFKNWICGGRVIEDIDNVIATGDMRISAAYEGYARITYVANGGEGEMPMQVYTNYSGDVQLALNAFTRTGYQFAGWSTNGSNDPVYDDGDTLSVSDGTAIALTACWAPITYTLKFDGNGGTCKLAPKTLTYDVPKKIEYEGGKVSRDHYDFLFWSTDPKETNVVYRWSLENEPVVTNLTTVADDTVVWYAIWKGVSQTVTINGKRVELEYGSQLDEKPADPEPKPGYAFSGDWTTNGEDAVDFPIVVTQDFDLEPLWNPVQYAVRFNPNGGEGEPYVQDMLCDVEMALAPNRFARTGYGFANWTNAMGTAYENGAKVTNLAAEGETNDLWAVWAPNRYWVKFERNGADGGKAMENQAFTYDVAQALTSNAFEKTGHSFAGWTANAAATGMSPPPLGDGAVVSNLTAEANATYALWATWAVKSYEISFNSAGGSAVGPVTNDYGKAVSEPTPTKKGYQFDGWYEGEVKFDFSSMPARNVALTAHWRANEYEVRFNSGEGSGAMGDQAFTYDVPQALTANGFKAPERKVFDCWTNETATGMSPPLLGDGEVVSNLTAEADGVVTLKATWKEVPSYTVAFDANGGEGEMSELRFECGKGGKLPANGFKRTGYTFNQWTNETATGMSPPLLGDGATFTVDLAPTNETAILSALWTPNRYWVKFEPNGADGGERMENQAFTYDVAQALTKNVFTRTGYGFAVWATNETATGMSPPPLSDGAVVSNLTAEADATYALRATWTANTYTVVYHGPDGATSDQPFTYDKEQKLKGADTFNPPEAWMVFAGWTNAVGKAYAADLTVSNLTAEAGGTVNLYVVWGDDSYTVWFDGNGATDEMKPQVFKHGETKALEPNEFNRIGHTFVKWTSDGDKEYDDKAAFTAPATGIGETLHAVWRAIVYTDSFDGSTETFAYGATVTRDTPSSKPGYTFKGWTTNGIDVIDLNPSTSTFRQPDHNVAFTSKWEPITYTVEFNANGGTGSVAPITAIYDQPIKLASSNDFSWSGHEFVAWTNANYNAQKKNALKSDAIVSNLTTIADEMVTLYAQWKESGDPLCMALKLPSSWTAANPGNAWTVIGAPVDGNGLQRTSTDESAYLEINVPVQGSLYFEFEYGGAEYAHLDVDFNGSPIIDEYGDSAEYYQSGKHTLQIETAGKLRFSGAPDADATWTLKEFKWTPAK